MFAKLGALCLLCAVVATGAERPDDSRTWDLAVTLDKEIVLLTNNGTLVATINDKFDEIKAVTYLYQKNLFVVGNRLGDNDTIYILDPLTLDATPVVEDLKDDIHGIAVDPVSEMVYWTDATNKSINVKSLRASQSKTPERRETLFDFQNEKPQDLAIDICKRMIYWTNANIETPTIEKSTIMGTDRKVLITDVIKPTAIAIDQLEQRLYWTDVMKGIYFRVESVDLDGRDRHMLFRGTHQKPFGLAVDKHYVYWTDTNENALWRMKKYSTDAPEHICTFPNQPNGIMSRFVGFPEEPNCEKLAVLVEQRHQAKENEKHNIGHVANENKTCPACVHGKQERNCACSCLPGYAGELCEMDVCYNFCYNGKCGVDEDGKPRCACDLGFSGSRCEKAECDNYCLNGGACHVTKAGRNEHRSVCTCPKGLSGPRCETVPTVSNYDVCKALCANSTDSVVVHDQRAFLCRCSDLSYMGMESSNGTQSVLPAIIGSFDTFLANHYGLIILACTNIVTAGVVIVLVVYTCRIKRMRPRIKKRVVVNKNVTPLTYRPQIEQCEITIEDCCNMNVCETPCFEPRNFQPKKDEKKVLLANMENNEEFY